MKTFRIILVALIFGLLSACQMHQGSFSKRKFLDLKKMESKEDGVTAENQDHFFKLNIDNDKEVEIEPTESLITDELTNDENSKTKVSEEWKIEFSQKEKIKKLDRFSSGNRSEIIVQSNRTEEKISTKKKQSTLLLFKRASLLFILGLALILWAVTGLYKPFLSEGGAFVSFMLGLIALLVSAIFVTKGMTKGAKEGSKNHKGARKEFVLFFGIFFIALSLLIVHGKI